MEIEEIKQSVSILELAKLYNAQPRRESGNTIQCRHNPLRDEKTSSLTLYPATNSWNDFGGSGGSIIDFIMIADNISTADAIKKIKSIAGIEDEHEAKSSYMTPNIINKIWSQQGEMTCKKELLAIAPQYVYDEASEDDSKAFFDIVRLEKQTKTAFVLLKDIDGDSRSLRYRRFSYIDEDGIKHESKWRALKNTQASFLYQRIKNKTDFVLIVEGTHDYLTAILCGYNVIAIPSSNFKISDNVLKDKICVFIDDDDGKNFMRPLFEEAKCSKIWFDHKEFKKKNKIKEAKDFSDYLDHFTSLESFKKAIELQCDIITNATYSTPSNRLQCFADITDDIEVPTWMIKNIIPSEGLMEIVGASGSYKSFIALDMMFCVSQGIEYHGHDVKQGTCIYVAGEGKNGAILRVRALEIKYGIKADNFYILPMPSNLMDMDEMDLLSLDIKAVNPNGVAMVLFDTLHRNSAGSDENSASDFSTMLGNIDKYIKKQSKIVGYIHHIGNNAEAAGRGRGTSSRFGAMDTSLLVKSNAEKTAALECTKQKDGERFEPIGFSLKTIDINLNDEYGEKLFNLAPQMDEEALKIQEAEKSKADKRFAKFDPLELINDIKTYIKENDGCFQKAILNHLDKKYPLRKIKDCITEHKDKEWRFGAKIINGYPLHAISDEVEVIEYDDGEDLF